ncbi:MAG: hypothetical protein DRP37_05675, partial [Thermodesulfobacteriota bacterium]
KLTKTVISSKARNLIVLKIQALKISPYGRNDKKRGFRSGTNIGNSGNMIVILFMKPPTLIMPSKTNLMKPHYRA